MKRSTASLLKYASIALYVSTAIAFASYFVILDNQAMILYSFALFVILGLFASIYSKLIKDLLSLSIVLIISSSITYFVITKALFPYVGAVLALSVAIVSFNLFGRYNAYAILALFLPVFFYAMKFNVYTNFAINVAVLGYYLLISAVIAASLSSIFSYNRLKFVGRIKKTVKSRGNACTLAVFVFAIALVVVPIWPLGYINLAKLPYANMYLEGAINRTAAVYAISFNAPQYYALENSNMSNIRFSYANGKRINAAMLNKTRNGSVTIFMHLNGTLLGSQNRILLHFLPYGTTFNSSLELIQPENVSGNLSAAVPILYTSGTPANAEYSYYNVTRRYPVVRHHTYNISTNSSMLPYYMIQSICPSGQNATVNVSIRSDAKVSTFVIADLSLLTRLKNRNPENYRNYLAAFIGNSTDSAVNTRHANLAINLSDCTYYVVTSNVTTDVSITEQISFYALGYNYTTTRELRADILQKNLTYYGPWGSGLPFLAHVYSLETSNSTAKK